MADIFLENEKLALQKKIAEAREKGNEGTYKNLIQAYERIINLIYQDEYRNKKYVMYFESSLDEKNKVNFYIGNIIINIDITKDDNEISCFLYKEIFSKYNIKDIYGNTETDNGKNIEKILNKLGFNINVTIIKHHMFEDISKKRLEKKPVAKINDTSAKEIDNAMKRLLNIEN